MPEGAWGAFFVVIVAGGRESLKIGGGRMVDVVLEVTVRCAAGLRLACEGMLALGEVMGRGEGDRAPS